MGTTRNFYRISLMCGLLVTAIMASMATIKVEVDGERLSFDVPPMMIQNRTMVPLRGVFEAMGAQVNWDAPTATITANKADRDVKLTVGNRSATVNGRTVMLDAPPMIVRGSTMVPLRFVSEALGADVKWLSASQTVSITTDGIKTTDYTPDPVQPNTGVVTIPAGTVIPVSLNTALSSATNKRGDAVNVTVRSAQNGDAEFPLGTTMRGMVSSVDKKGTNQPGMLELTFQSAQLPNGMNTAITGSLISLDEKSVTQADGRIIAKDKTNKDSLKFIAIGTGAGLLIGKLLDENLFIAGLLGAAAGYVYSEINKDSVKSMDVAVPAGTQFGIRLDRAIAYTASKEYVAARADYLRQASTNMAP